MTMRRILLLNGPNLDMLGMREPDIYGSDTLAGLEEMVMQYAGQRGLSVTPFQSNSESKLIGRIHEARGVYDGIVYNPGAHTHYSYALRDAIASVDVPVVEVHISDIDSREPFRSVSVIAPACIAQVKGLGLGGYCRAVDVLLENDGLCRLGEGYARRFAPEERIIVAKEAETANEPSAPVAIEVPCADAGQASSERLGRVREACSRMGLDALLVRDTPNIAWLTMFDGVFDDERAHSLLVSPGCAVLHTDSRYSNAMRTVASAIGSSVEVSDERVSHAKLANGLVAEGSRMGIEDSITYAEFVKMTEEFGAERLAATTDLVLGLRAVKGPLEIARLKAAQAITDAAFAHIVRFMKPGMTEREVQLELEDYMMRHGAEGLAFRSIVATGANGADPHAVPGSTRLEAGQCVVMDFGAKAAGYCADMTRTVFLGQPEGVMADAWRVLRRANEEVEAMLKPGVTGKEAHELAERVLAEGGFEGKMGHGLGHGVGLEVHELPVLNPRNDKPLVAGNVVTVEPGIYLPGQFGMRLEDCGVIEADSYKPFSELDHEMVVI